MNTELSDIDQRLGAFNARNSPAGRLARYASGRVSHFASRQILTLSGAISLVVLTSPAIGALAVSIALLGEAIDCLFLRHVPGLLERNPARFGHLYVLSMLSGILQSITIAFCVVLAWGTAPGDAAMFFCLAYVTGASINAGIVLPFHKGAAIGRLGVYLVTVCGLLMAEMLQADLDHADYAYNLLGAVMMGYMVCIFISYVVTGQKREYRNSRDLLLQGRALAHVNSSLQEQQKDARTLSLVARGAHDSVILSDPSGRIAWVNNAFSRITGFTLDEACGKRPAELLNGPDTDLDTSEGIAQAVANGQSHRAEIINYTKDGRKIWIETNIAPVFDDEGEVEMVIAIERDITATKTHEAELAEAKLAAEQGERAKSRFLAIMSHEIRTPMNGIMGMADLLAEEDMPHETRLFVDTIRDSADALLTIINDILDFSKLDAGHMQLSPVPFRPEDCIRGVLNLLTPQAATKGLSLTLQGEETLPRVLLGDDTRLRQILMNVIGNAIKFTETGGVCVTVDSQRVGPLHNLSIHVTDTGIGIDAARIPTIFDQFSQADAATTRQFGGTGLGLAISRSLARIMGGDVTATSQPGRGSCFHITVQFARTRSIPQAVSQDQGDEVRLKDVTVLLAEDNRTNRLLVEKYTKGQPMTLLTAENGREAVDLTRRLLPDIILMDMSMPVMDGLEATRRIRALPIPQPHIIALTANAYASDRAACRKAGMDGFLSKPVRKQNLLRELAAIGVDHVPSP